MRFKFAYAFVVILKIHTSLSPTDSDAIHKHMLSRCDLNSPLQVSPGRDSDMAMPPQAGYDYAAAIAAGPMPIAATRSGAASYRDCDRDLDCRRSPGRRREALPGRAAAAAARVKTKLTLAPSQGDL